MNESSCYIYLVHHLSYGLVTKKVGGAGVVLIPLEGETLKYVVRLQFTTTKNEAEYEALLIGLSLAKALGARNLIVQANS